MKLRKGNNEEREYSVGAGILGTDIALEGPFHPGGSSSYLVNYRYSSLAILSDLGILDFGGIPKYQDLAFNLNFPTDKAGMFSLFGIGGLSRIDEEFFEEDGETIRGKDVFKSYMGTLNLGHIIFIGKQTSFDSYAGLSMNGSRYRYHERKDATDGFVLEYTDGLDKYAFRFGTTLNSKISNRHTLRSGFSYQLFSFDFNQEYMDDHDEWVIGLFNEG
ncbi:MAG: TonB-dependent receptor, partial [Cyclobacteriaceae bacterium]